MNISTLLPALFKTIIPMFLEVMVGVVFIAIFYDYLAAIQFLLFVSFTFASYRAAEGKADRNKQMMMVMFSQWGKILSTANAYERAHYFDNIDYEVGRAREAFDDIGVNMDNVLQRDHSSGAKLNCITLSLTAVFFIIVAGRADELEGAQVLALIMYFFFFVGSLESYAGAMAELRSALFEYTALTEFVSKKSGVADEKDPIELPIKKNPVIEFQGVTFSYGGRKILDDVSFRVEGGQTLGLVGSSGCGKSTILRLLMRFYRQSAGTITIDGHDITKVSGASLRRLFSVVTQDSQLFNASIRDNIAYGKMGSVDKDILHAASLAELKIDDDDLALDKNCGEKGAKLSGGQQQRVAIARAMLKNGTIYLLDEPTTGLDGIVARQLQITLDKLATNATTLMVTHHLQDLKNADLILYLDKGKIVERGTYQGLCDAKGVFYKQTMARDRSGEGGEDADDKDADDKDADAANTGEEERKEQDPEDKDEEITMKV